MPAVASAIWSRFDYFHRTAQRTVSLRSPAEVDQRIKSSRMAAAAPVGQKCGYCVFPAATIPKDDTAGPHPFFGRPASSKSSGPNVAAASGQRTPEVVLRARASRQVAAGLKPAFQVASCASSARAARVTTSASESAGAATPIAPSRTVTRSPKCNNQSHTWATSCQGPARRSRSAARSVSWLSRARMNAVPCCRASGTGSAVPPPANAVVLIAATEDRDAAVFDRRADRSQARTSANPAAAASLPIARGRHGGVGARNGDRIRSNPRTSVSPDQNADHHRASY